MVERDDELVQVWVPKRFLSQIYGRVAELEGGVEPGVVHHPSDLPEWTASLLGQAYEEASPGMQSILRHLSEKPEKGVPAEELTALLRTVMDQPKGDHTLLAGVVGAWARWVKNHHGFQDGKGRAVLPFTKVRDRKLGQKVYTMPKRYADIIRKL